MKLVLALLALAGMLALQVLLGMLSPRFAVHLDLMMLPVVWYGTRGTPRSAMLVGAAGGLLQDAWFQAGVFGISGFKKTLLGYALATLGSRIELNHAAGRFLAAGALVLGDRVLQVGLCRLLDVAAVPLSPWTLPLRAVGLGLLAVVAFPIMNRWSRKDSMRRPRRIRRRA